MNCSFHHVPYPNHNLQKVEGGIQLAEIEEVGFDSLTIDLCGIIMLKSVIGKYQILGC